MTGEVMLGKRGDAFSANVFSLDLSLACAVLDAGLGRVSDLRIERAGRRPSSAAVSSIPHISGVSQFEHEAIAETTSGLCLARIPAARRDRMVITCWHTCRNQTKRILECA